MKTLINIFIVLIIFTTINFAQEKMNVNPNIDFVSRYVWRGIDIGNTPSIQPSLALTYQGLTVGSWGAYTLSNQTSNVDEIDFWISYEANLGNIIITPIVTDYYYPNAGTRLFNFEDGTGAHLLEAGLIVSGNDIPLSLSGYYNFHNEAGNNTYFELSYSMQIDDINLNSFIGAAGGSKDNPGYYNTENFNVINIGLKATKELKVTETFNLPVFVSVVVNPRNEVTHLIAGFSL